MYHENPSRSSDQLSCSIYGKDSNQMLTKQNSCWGWDKLLAYFSRFHYKPLNFHVQFLKQHIVAEIRCTLLE